MKRKWRSYINSNGMGVFVCKICDLEFLNKCNLLFHIKSHNKWEKRKFERDMLRFNYYNYYRNKPISYFVGQIINIENLFEVNLFEIKDN